MLEEVRKWLRSNPGKVAILFQIATLFGLALDIDVYRKNTQKGFEKTDIWLTNESIFTHDDLLPGETTDFPVAGIQEDPTPVYKPESKDAPTIDRIKENKHKETET